MSTESESMFARRPKRYLKRMRRELVELAIEEKGLTRATAQRGVDNLTDEQIMHATTQAGITADQIEDGGGSWFDWLRDVFKKIDWLKVAQILLPLILLFLGEQERKRLAEDDGA